MKKLALSILIFTTLSQAQTYTKQDRINHMHILAEAMNEIQTGFFFNSYETIASGVTKLSDTIVQIRPPLEEAEEQDPMAKFLNEKIKMTSKIVKKINRRSLTILERFKDGDPVQALQAYSSITEQCMKCHSEMRSY